MVHSTNLKGEVRPLTTGDFDYGAGLALCGKNLIVTRHSISAPDDIYSLSFKKKKNAEVRQLTREDQYFQERLKMGEVKERWVATTDGKKELCWVVYPPHFDPSKKYPILLFCEGGPQSPVSQFWSYRWNLQIMAANDYIVIAPNRRGLPGFGMEWLEEISGDYSGQCMQDYLSAIDDIAKNRMRTKTAWDAWGPASEATACTIWPDTTTNASNASSRTTESSTRNSNITKRKKCGFPTGTSAQALGVRASVPTRTTRKR